MKRLLYRLGLRPRHTSIWYDYRLSVLYRSMDHISALGLPPVPNTGPRHWSEK